MRKRLLYTLLLLLSSGILFGQKISYPKKFRKDTVVKKTDTVKVIPVKKEDIRELKTRAKEFILTSSNYLSQIKQAKNYIAGLEADFTREKAEWKAKLSAESPYAIKTEVAEVEYIYLQALKVLNDQNTRESEIKAALSAIMAADLLEEMRENEAYIKKYSNRVEELKIAINAKTKNQGKELQDKTTTVNKSYTSSVSGIELINGKFFDDFSDNRNNWPLYKDENKSMEIANGKLRIHGLKTNFSFFSNQHFNIDLNQDFSCSVTTKWLEGVNNYGYGLSYCSNATSGSYYIFYISANGYYCIKYFENNGDWKDIKDWTSTSIINQNFIPNLISIKKQGNYISFYINDIKVESYPFDGGYGNHFGVRLGNKQTVEFDNFTIIGKSK